MTFCCGFGGQYSVCVSTRVNKSYMCIQGAMQYMYFFECITCKSQKNAKARRKISLAKGWGWGKSSFDDVQ